MTREERHIAVLSRLLESMDVYDSVQPTTERKKAIKAAIKALSQEPCETCCGGIQTEKAKLCQKSYLAGMEHRDKQEPCDDAISLTKEAYSDLCLRASKADDLQRALDMEKGAYNALVKNIQCEDAISRDDAITAINKLYDECEEWRALSDLQYGKNQGLSLAIDVIEELPPVTQKSAKDYLDMADRKAKKIKDALIVTQKSGKWHIAHGMYEDRFWCSCGYIRIMDSRMNEWKYCPVCGGAKMVEPQESEDKE